MKIVVLSGSPHKKGTSALLVEEFMAAAREKGHAVQRIDCAYRQVAGCRGCDYCVSHDGQCVQQDDMADIRAEILAADLVVFASGVYYFGMTAQLKAVIDRFYAINTPLMESGKKAALLLTCADTDASVMDAPVAHYRAICDYLGWQDVGMVLGVGLGARADAEQSEYPAQARQLGLSL